MRVSVVIPTLNESAAIVETLSRLAGSGADEVVVADATSPDGTATLARAAGATVIDSPRGRGSQQNRGAAATTGEILLFLHADCQLESGAVAELRRFAQDHPCVPGGCFRMRVDSDAPIYRAIDAAAHVRAGILGLPYGDQGIWATRAAFDRVGGFPDVPLMEDLLLSSRLCRLGRLALLSSTIHVSSRRWQHQGVFRQTFRNWALTVAAAAGVPTSTLASFYPVIR